MPAFFAIKYTKDLTQANLILEFTKVPPASIALHLTVSNDGGLGEAAAVVVGSSTSRGSITRRRACRPCNRRGWGHARDIMLFVVLLVCAGAAAVQCGGAGHQAGEHGRCGCEQDPAGTPR